MIAGLAARVLNKKPYRRHTGGFSILCMTAWSHGFTGMVDRAVSAGVQAVRSYRAPNSKRPQKLWRIKPCWLSYYSWCCVSSYIALPESIYVDLSPWLSRSPILASPCLPSSWSSKPAHGIHLQQSVSPALPSWLHCLSISVINQAASRMEV